jgi:hypothetical protein
MLDMIDNRDPETIQDKASKLYKIYKEWYTVSLQELDYIEKMTGIDTYFLRLKQNLDDFLYEKDKNKKVSIYKKAMQEEISYRKEYNKLPWYQKLSTGFQDRPVTGLENQLNSFNPDTSIDSKDNLYDFILDGYIKEIDKQKEKIEKQNENRYPLFKKNTEQLEAAKVFLQYHRTLRMDLINPSKGLLMNTHTPEEDKIKQGFFHRCKAFLNGIFSKKKNIVQLGEIYKIKTETARKFINHVQFPDANTIAEKIHNKTPLEVGYVEFDIFQRYKKNEQGIHKFVKNIDFPLDLKKYVDTINAYIDLVQKVKEIIALLKQNENNEIVETVMDDFVKKIQLTISDVNNKIKNWDLEVNDDIKNFFNSLENKFSKENKLNSSDLEETMKLILKLKPDDILKKPSCLQGANLSNETLEELVNQTKELGKLNIQRTIDNIAKKFSTINVSSRDLIANDLNDAIKKTANDKFEQLNNDKDFQAFKNIEKKYINQNKNAKETVLNHFKSIKEVLPTHLLHIATLFEAFLKCSTPSNENKYYPLEKIGLEVKSIQDYSKSLSKAIYTQQEYLRVLQKRLHDSYEAYIKNNKLEKFFIELINILEPKRDSQDKRDVVQRYKDYMTQSIQPQLNALSDIVFQLRDIKQAVKYLGGQLTYKCKEGNEFDYTPFLAQ